MSLIFKEPSAVECTTTNADATVTTADTSALAASMTVAGRGIPSGATISSITDGTTFELSTNATLSATNNLSFQKTLGGSSSGISGTGTVFTEYRANITGSDDDISAIYVDWADGQTPDGIFTNDKRYANYQWVQLTDPKSEITVDHTYTATGTYYPVVQMINSKGFASAYYAAQATGSLAANYPLPYKQETLVSGVTINDGEATAVLRAENKTVKSGIDNSIFQWEGPRDLFLFIAPTLTQTELGYLNPLKIDIDVELIDASRDRDSTDTKLGGSARLATLNVELTGTNLTNNAGMLNILASGNGSTQGSYSALVTGAQVKRVLKVTYKNPKYMTSKRSYAENAAYNKMKVFVCAYSDSVAKEASAAVAYRPICYVTPGSPIKKVGDNTRNVTLDFSQSRAKASNVSLSSYRYDEGKMWYNAWNAWSMNDSYTGNYFTDNTKTSGTYKKVSYTYEPTPLGVNAISDADGLALATTTSWDTTDAKDGQIDQFLLDDFGRFTDIYHCARVSTQPASAANNSGSEVSSLTSNKPYVFRITPHVTVPTGGVSNYEILPTKLIGSGTLGGCAQMSYNYTTGAWTNIKGAADTAAVELDTLNSMSFVDFNQEARQANEYLLLLFSKKTNNIFFNINAYAENMMSTAMVGTSPLSPPWSIGGVYYLSTEGIGTSHTTAEWKPLEYFDGTALTKQYRNTGSAGQTGSAYSDVKFSLAKSGPLTFDMPIDWTAVNLTEMCGGVFAEEETASTAGTADVTLTGARKAADDTDEAGYGKAFCFSGSGIGTAMANAGFTNTAQVGAWKYVFIPHTKSSGGDTMNKAYWVVKSGTVDGWDGTNSIWCQYGDTNSNNGMDPLTDTISTTGSLRRVNIYDVVDGYAKAFNAGTTSDIELCPVEGRITAFSNRYQIAQDDETSGAGFDLMTAWNTDKYYAIKIVLNGGTGSATGITPGTYPVIKNIFDGNRGYHEVIKQIDDSGYNLNSQPITSDVSVTRAGTYYQAVTRKGKVFIQRTGTPIQSIGFSSIAAGDESASAVDQFAAASGSSLMGHLHTMRRIQADSVRVYWDEPQKDGTYVRFWGIVNSLSETHPVGSPVGKVDYSFQMTVEEIALIDGNGLLMSDLIPLGGVIDERSVA